MDCDPLALNAFCQGLLPAPEREVLARHAADCPDCQQVLLLLGKDEGAPVPPEILARLKALRPPARALPWRAAAAVLLLALPAAFLLRRDAAPAKPPSPAPDSSLPGLAPGIEILAEPGTRSETRDGRIRLESGILWVDAEQGILDLPDASLSLAQATVQASIPKSAAWSWLGEVLAAEEPAATVSVLRGTATLTSGGLVLEAGEGSRLVRKSGGWVREGIPDLEALRLSLAEASARRPGRTLFAAQRLENGHLSARDGAPGAYRWVTVLERRDSSAELEFTLGLGKEAYRWVPALAATPGSPREIVEILWDGARLKGRVNGRQAFACGLEEAGRMLSPALSAPWRLAVSGGGVTVVGSKLQEIP